MKRPKILVYLESYANALSRAARWHDSDQCICFGEENCPNQPNRFYIRQFLEMMEELDALKKRKFKICPVPHDASLMIPRNLKVDTVKARIIAKLGRERHYFPKVRGFSRQVEGKPAGSKYHSVLIRIKSQGPRKNMIQPQDRFTIVSGVDPINVINHQRVTKFRYNVIRGLPGDYVLATKA